MGVVYSATHPLIGKRAAIKVLQPELSNNPAAVERFVMEARAVNQIGHPNIVDIFAFGALPDGSSYYVMDLLTGESLRRRLTRGPLHVAEAASVIDEIASALIAAHDKGIIHRDLKPDNVFMVSVPGRWPDVRILDWGLLKLSSTQNAVGGGKYRTLAGSLLGTPVYMSPEQARASESVDFRADIYSLGVLAYEILAGEVPFRRGNSIDTLLAHQDEPVPPLAAKCPALPEELVQLIEAMLAKDPDERPTLAAVRAVIKRLRGSKIPTMTAAGLEMPSFVTPFVEPTTNSHPTLADGAGRERDAPMQSMEMTVPRQAARLSRDDLPLPPPPQTPLGEMPRLSPGGSGGFGFPSQPLPHPSSPSQVGVRIPPHLQSSSQPSIPIPPYPEPPSLSQPNMSAQQMPYPQRYPSSPSQPPYAQPQPQPQPQGNGRRIAVILIVAVIASAVGIVLLLTS
jgi:serine/threonine protein kinase